MCRWGRRRVGASDVQVVEPPDAIKTVLVRWKKVKLDLNELAKLRWIKKLTAPEICRSMGKGRTAVLGSIRTLRKCGISGLNLTPEEKKVVLAQMKRENTNSRR